MRHVTLILRGQGAPETLTVVLEGSRCQLSRGGVREDAQLTRLPDGRLSLLFDDGRQICGRVLAAGEGEVEVFAGGRRSRVAIAEPLRDRLAHAAATGGGRGEDEQVRAPMPGRVVEIGVAPGDRVAPGALLLVLEAMKMQNEIRTTHGGTVFRVDAIPGSTVEGGSLLVIVKSDSDPPSGPSKLVD